MSTISRMQNTDFRDDPKRESQQEWLGIHPKRDVNHNERQSKDDFRDRPSESFLNK